VTGAKLGAMRFLSDEWFSAAHDRLRDVRAPDGAACCVQFDAGGTPWSLTWEPGGTIALEPGRREDAAVELQWSRPDGVAIWRREVRDAEAMQRTTAVATDANGELYTGPPCPGDIARRDELRDLPRLADASVTVQYLFSDGPFGAVPHVLVFEEGRLTRDLFGVVDEPDVVVRVPYEAIAPVRCGERSILDAIANGAIEGEIGPMAVLAGILESPDFQAAERATGRHGFALAALGLLDADPAYAAAMTELAAKTDAE
jgi:hypothetical protein